MRNILGYYLMPHPPIIIPEVGKGEENQIQETSDACVQIGEEIKELSPDTIILITPHGTMFQDAVALSYDEEIKGSLKQFRAPNVKMNKRIDLDLTNDIINLSNIKGVPTAKVDAKLLKRYNRDFELDHGSIVPLYFIDKHYKHYKLVHITYGLLSDVELYELGNIIKEAIANMSRKSVIIASGDLSHKLSDEGPYPFSPKGEQFDAEIIKHLKNGNILEIFNMDKHLIEEAGECGFNSILILLGAMGNFKGELMSYEGTFGVGYGVMKFNVIDDANSLDEIVKNKSNKQAFKVQNSDEYVKLARKSLVHYLQNSEELEVPSNLPKDLLEEKAGVFVSLKKYGHLRGCIGTFLPTKKSIAEEIIHNAVEAATSDPRFNEVRMEELDDIDISVDILTKPEKATKDELDPKIYGVIVSKGYKRGLLLPDLEGVDTVETQLEIACNKAGINPGSHYDIEKFRVIRHVEGDLIHES